VSEGRLDESAAAHFLGEHIRPALLGWFDFASGPARAWMPGPFPIQWGGHEWLGCGALVHVAEMEEASEGRAISTEIELSPLPLRREVDGVDLDLLRAAHDEGWHMRPARLYIGLFHATSLAWLLEPKQFRKGFMDVMELTEAGQVARIRLTLESRHYDLERAEVLRYTPAAQRALYPGDAFFDQVPLLQDRPITWNLG
jgi:hypothetical protein